MKNVNLLIFRQDLRISDNPALLQASLTGQVIPIYILDDNNIGSASKYWLHNSLKKLNEKLGNNLHFYKGNAHDIILKLVKDNKIDSVYWNRCYEPWRIKSDIKIKNSLKKHQIECNTYNASLLWEPWKILKSDKTSYKVFTPYYKNGCLKSSPPRPIEGSPENIIFKKLDDSLDIEELDLLKGPAWYQSLDQYWDIGEDAAQDKLYNFLDNGLNNYQEGRNFPSKKNISRLSPHLHFGEISPHQIWHVTEERKHINGSLTNDANIFLSEIGWREFSYYLLYHFPDLPTKNFQSKFDNFPWQEDSSLLKAWQTGQTGYPIVDAGMRELWQTGYMHNRVRMIVGSFLVKNLLLHWKHGEAWFWDCLLDADLASNSASWQWIAGSGADAAPYFRIFNPITQGERFDAEGSYTRKFVPEIASLPDEYLFKPWQAPENILTQAGVKLGSTYPNPIIDIKSSREKALSAYSSLKLSSIDQNKK